MRVLLAIDGSISSDRARDLVASLTLPAGSRVRVVGVVEHGSELFGLPWMPGVSNDTSTIEPAPTERFVEELEVAEREIARRNVVVDHLLLRGHAARAIVDEAREFGAEVVVVGSRGHGSFSTTVLGSTSAEVVDHAPCPVLVVRRSRIAIRPARGGRFGRRGRRGEGRRRLAHPGRAPGDRRQRRRGRDPVRRGRRPGRTSR